MGEHYHTKSDSMVEHCLDITLTYYKVCICLCNFDIFVWLSVVRFGFVVTSCDFPFPSKFNHR